MVHPKTISARALGSGTLGPTGGAKRQPCLEPMRMIEAQCFCVPLSQFVPNRAEPCWPPLKNWVTKNEQLPAHAMSPYDPPEAITVVAEGGDGKPDAKSYRVIVPMLSLL